MALYDCEYGEFRYIVFLLTAFLNLILIRQYGLLSKCGFVCNVHVKVKY